LAAMNMISYSWWPWPFEGHFKWTTINFDKFSISLKHVKPSNIAYW